MSYLDNFNIEKIDSIPEVKQQLRFLKKAIDKGEVGYTKPTTGIPASDMSEEVQEALLIAKPDVLISTIRNLLQQQLDL